MKYVLIINGAVEKYPYSFRGFKEDHPNISVRNDMSALVDYGVFPVVDVLEPDPVNPMTHRVVEVDPVWIAPDWTQTWVEEELSAEEQADRLAKEEMRMVKAAIKANPWIIAFSKMTVAEVEAFISGNVTNLASAKNVIEKLAIICLLLVKGQR